MIPPSVPLVIYAILTQESIGKLFVAAVVPGLIAMVGYMIVVQIVVTLRPASGPAGPRVALGRTPEGVGRRWHRCCGVFLVVIVGIYGGWANPDRGRGHRRSGLRHPGGGRRGGMRWRGLRRQRRWARRRPPR